MSTQIFVASGGCKPEYTKIAAISFQYNQPLSEDLKDLYIGGPSDNLPMWSFPFYGATQEYIAGSIDQISISRSGCAIPIPINFIPGDKITFSGTAYCNQARIYQEAGYDVKLVIGVYYFNCSDLDGSATPYTFVPIETYLFDIFGKVCFTTDVTLNSNYDLHETRLIVGVQTYIQCTIPGDSCTPPPVADSSINTVSYTLDVERPCATVTPRNFIIKNCCEPAITELVNASLIVGNFYVDDQGNCWEVISESSDVTNFTRTFTTNYTSCVECQAANPCPENFKIVSCCYPGQEYVSASLPGLAVGDSFVDNYGQCWRVDSTTGAPITEEAITVASVYTGPNACTTCVNANPCPTVYAITSCCTNLAASIASNVPMNIDDSFVDTMGQCWYVKDIVDQIPSTYGIIVDHVYTGGTSDFNCTTCTTANTCPTEYYIQIRSCCDPLRIEWAQVPAEYMIFVEDSIFRDEWRLCWQVLSFQTSAPTPAPANYYEIWSWTITPSRFNLYIDCTSCRTNQKGCSNVYRIKDCQTNIEYTAFLGGLLTPLVIGGIYNLSIGESDDPVQINSCFTILGYGYPTMPNTYFYGSPQSDIFVTCEDCLLK